MPLAGGARVRLGHSPWRSPSPAKDFANLPPRFTMAKYDPDRKPSGDDAKEATKTDLPDGFTIARTIQAGRISYGPGREEKYRDSKPSKADVSRLVEGGAITLPAKASTS